MEEEAKDAGKKESTYKRPKYYIREEPYFPLHKCGEIISCTYCGANITDTIQFRCNECPNILCKKCIMSRQEKNGHLASHGYHVSECLESMPLYALDWSAKDELRLMEAMDEFRFCNWENISNYVDKPERACVEHIHALRAANPQSAIREMFGFCFIEGGGFMTLGGMDAAAPLRPLCWTHFSSMERYFRVFTAGIFIGSQRAFRDLGKWNS
ncbi:uncharacterized protein [Blastocystis hominis]|uniref:ZZ-type domain-containing protein n=1 Tax=Blastocystis hominis TaxID=12968 RepID=D8M0E0_BLAHO|nr:uncharacterized protein [Blastocystis hominis]CBK21529.2 unnamed protein product [Blastocystis hominis]|eukprot:XP_012895577.1 uncharacterized protein [Blastocystis hominis]